MDKRSFFWSRVFLLGLVASCAVLTVAGIAATYVDLPAEFAGLEGSLDAICALAFAGIAGFALGVSQMAAAMAVTLRAPAHRQGPLCAFNLAVGCSIICGFISLGGIHLGAERLGLDPFWLDVAGGALCLVKPTMAYLTEASREVSRLEAIARAAASDAAFYADRDKGRDLEALRYSQPPAQPQALPAPAPIRRQAKPRKRNRGVMRKVAEGVALAAAAATAGASAPAFAEAPAPIQGEAKLANPRPSFDDVDRAKAALEARGVQVSQSALAAHIGCSRNAVRRALGLLQ